MDLNNVMNIVEYDGNNCGIKTKSMRRYEYVTKNVRSFNYGSILDKSWFDNLLLAF